MLLYYWTPNRHLKLTGCVSLSCYRSFTPIGTFPAGLVTIWSRISRFKSQNKHKYVQYALIGHSDATERLRVAEQLGMTEFCENLGDLWRSNDSIVIVTSSPFFNHRNELRKFQKEKIWLNEELKTSWGKQALV